MKDFTTLPKGIYYTRNVADDAGLAMVVVERIAPVVGAKKDRQGLWVFNAKQRRLIIDLAKKGRTV